MERLSTVMAGFEYMVTWITIDVTNALILKGYGIEEGKLLHLMKNENGYSVVRINGRKIILGPELSERISVRAA